MTVVTDETVELLESGWLDKEGRKGTSPIRFQVSCVCVCGGGVVPWQKCDHLWTEFCWEGGWVSLCYPLEVPDVYNAVEATESFPFQLYLIAQTHSSFPIQTRLGRTRVTGRTNLFFFWVPRNLPILHYWALLRQIIFLDAKQYTFPYFVIPVPLPVHQRPLLHRGDYDYSKNAKRMS